MKKFNMDELKSVSTLMSTVASLDPNENSEAVGQREYRRMIGSLLYLTMTQMDIQFTICLCACFRPLHALHIRRQFNEFSGTSNTLLSLGFDILLFLCLILLTFPMLILWVMGLTERALMLLAILSNLLLFAGLLENYLQLHRSQQRLSM
jgi:hypothetical protein